MRMPRARHLVALGRHALRIGNVIALLDRHLRPLAGVGTDGGADYGAGRCANLRAAAPADSGAKTGAEGRAQKGFADSGGVCRFRLARDTLARILLADLLVGLERFKRFVRAGHHGNGGTNRLCRAARKERRGCGGRNNGS
jgi:hypothetical protein